MIRLEDIITEIDDKNIKTILKKIFGVPKKMPKYVFKDFIMSDNGFFPSELKRILKDNPSADEDDIAFEFEDWINIKWKKKVVILNASDFTKANQKTMIKRKFGDANPGQVPDDEARTDFQRKLANKRKPGTNENNQEEPTRRDQEESMVIRHHHHHHHPYHHHHHHHHHHCKTNCKTTVKQQRANSISS